jgi:hypothetical protein
MSNGKAVGPDNMPPIEVEKSLGDRDIGWLAQFFKEIMKSNRMSDEWRKNTLIPIY